MGDYDINLMNYENHSLTSDFAAWYIPIPSSQTKFKVENGNSPYESLIISNNLNDIAMNIGPSLAMKIPKQILDALLYMGRSVTH